MESNPVSVRLVASLTLAGVCVIALLFGVAAFFDDDSPDQAATPLLSAALSFEGDDLDAGAYLDTVAGDLMVLDSQRSSESLARLRSSYGDDAAAAELRAVARSACVDASGGASTDAIRDALSQVDHATELEGQGAVVAFAASVVLCPDLMERALEQNSPDD